MVWQTGNQDRDNVAGVVGLGESMDFVVYEFALVRVRRADYDQPSRSTEMPLDGLVIFCAGKIFKVAEDIKPAVRHI